MQFETFANRKPPRSAYPSERSIHTKVIVEAFEKLPALWYLTGSENSSMLKIVLVHSLENENPSTSLCPPDENLLVHVSEEISPSGSSSVACLRHSGGSWQWQPQHRLHVDQSSCNPKRISTISVQLLAAKEVSAPPRQAFPLHKPSAAILSE